MTIKKYLKFMFDGLFTKLLKPVYATLRSMGHLSSGYIDDSYLQGDSYLVNALAMLQLLPI